MKVVVLVRSRLWGGLESHAVDLVHRLAERGHEARIACVGRTTTDLFLAHDPSLPIATVAEPSGPGSVLHWWREFRALRADACIFEKGTLHTGSFQLDFAARLSFRAFLVIEQLEPPVLGPLKRRRVLGLPSPGIWWYRQRFAGWLRSLGPHRVVCISEAVRLALENDYGFARTRTTIIHNGVDVDRFHPSLREAARRTLGLDDDATVVATACRLVPQKGVDVAIQSLARVVAQSPSSPARLLVAGEGPERPALERLVDELGLSKRVRFMGFTGDTALFIPAADVFLVPSRIEAQGIVLLEALASGCDVIASRVGGVPEVARPPDVGTLVTADDADALAEALAAALRRTTPQRATRAKAARQHVEELFDARRQCGRIIDLMEELAR